MGSPAAVKWLESKIKHKFIFNYAKDGWRGFFTFGKASPDVVAAFKSEDLKAFFDMNVPGSAFDPNIYLILP
ncbi:hypothetical protein DRF67_10605 [Chryseobacterium pennipullorum]|uniref:Uncharacterized protein n=1 Tax=Chryseobacterium pennipullorum TaxID=2258963 RepID=A0A3D9B1E3_9FLAO|nr:hypothetical protein DRF67_10605 [Chryseobacterium pennipullorum]